MKIKQGFLVEKEIEFVPIEIFIIRVRVTCKNCDSVP